jgi:hypothetical protein
MFHITPSLYLSISLFQFLSAVPRHLPNDALGSELAVKLWIDTLTAMIDVEAFTALLTGSGFVLLTDSNGITIFMMPALHPSCPILIIPD